jgi:hypothetical protein
MNEHIVVSDTGHVLSLRQQSQRPAKVVCCIE